MPAAALRPHDALTATPRPQATPSAEGAAPAGGDFATRLRKFLPATAVMCGAALAVCAAVAVIILLAVDAPFAALPALVGALWLQLNCAPVSVSGASLGVGPSLIVVLFGVWQAIGVRSKVRERVSVSDVRMLAGCHLAVPTVVTILSYGLVAVAPQNFPIAPAAIHVGILKTLLLAGLCLVLGMGPRLWKALLRFTGLPLWLVDSTRLGLFFVAALWGLGALCSLGLLIVHHQAASEAYAAYSSDPTAARLGLTILGIVYFPTMAAGAGAVVAGSEAHFGPALFSLFSSTQAQLPALPLLAALPTGTSPVAWVGVLIPAAVAILIFRRFLESREQIVSPYSTVAAAAVAAGVAAVVGSLLLSGQLGTYGSVGMNWALTGLVSVAWVLIVGAVYLAVLGAMRGREEEPSQPQPEDTEEGSV